jgi:hypothetical protein
MAPSRHLLRNLRLFRFPNLRRAADRLRARPYLESFEDRLALNYSFGAAAFQPPNVTTADPAVFVLINHADDLAVPVNLGANQFNFYGTTYQGPSSLYASSNGLITFGSGNPAYQNTDLTSQPFQPAIAPLWTDWLKLTGGPMLLGKLDTADNELILQWDQVLHQQSTAPATFQMVLQLNTGNVPGNITVNYLSINTGDRNANGATSTVGVKDVGFQGANRLLASFNSTNPLIQSNQAVQFAWNNPNPPPSLNSLSLTTAPEGSVAQLVTLTGSNFVSNSTAQVNGSPVTTMFQSATQLQAIIPAKALIEEGNLAVSVVNPGSQAQTSNVLPFAVTDAPLSAGGSLLNATEGAAFTGTVATFTDAALNASVYDYQATILWGDGQSSPGTISANGQGGFSVTGSHAYEEGIYPLSVQIADAGGATATANSTVFVADAPLAATAAAVSAVEGSTFTGPVATFTDANPNAPAGDFSATITWAPGQTTAGTVTVNPAGGFVVTGTFTFAEEGSYPASVTITDQGGASAQVAGSATVADAPLSAAGVLVNAAESTPVTLPVATFTDADPSASLSDYQVTIGWGDGQSSPGTISANGQGGFSVTGSHTYAEEGIYPVSVQIADVGGATATASGTAFVADAPLTAAAAAVNATEGVAFSGTVATFTDANPNAPAGDFSATITWAPGQTTAGTVTANPAGGFVVTGAFTYAEEGTYPVSVTITDQGGASAQVSTSAVVVDAPLTAAGVAPSATEGVSFSGVVATFADANPNSTAADFTATITWGDGQTSAGTITANPAGGFVVSGTNTYAEEGSYPVTVSILDQGGATAAASTTAAVVDAPLNATGLTLSATESAAFHGAVATFTDANPNATAGEFSATILWGDGATSAGTVTANADGSFAVSGDHVYAEEGCYPVTVTVLDQGGSAATAYGVAQVTDSIPVVNAWVFQGWDAQRVYLLVHYTDMEREHHTVRIDWGDGTVTGERLGVRDEGFLFLTHRYSERFVRHHPGGTCIVVTVADGEGTTSDPEVLAVAFHRHHPW